MKSEYRCPSRLKRMAEVNARQASVIKFLKRTGPMTMHNIVSKLAKYGVASGTVRNLINTGAVIRYPENRVRNYKNQEYTYGVKAEEPELKFTRLPDDNSFPLGSAWPFPLPVPEGRVAHTNRLDRR